MNIPTSLMGRGLRHALTRPSYQVRALLALTGANVIWGTFFIATKPVLDHVPPLTLAFLRFAIALAILWPLAVRTGSRPRFDRAAALLGFTGIFCMYTAQNVGLVFTSVTNATLIQAGIPVLTVLLAAAFLGERLRPPHAIGAGLSLAAVAAVVLCGGGADARVSLGGDLLLVVSAASFAIYLVIGRRAFAHGPILATVTGAVAWGLLFLIPGAAIEISATGVESVTPRDGSLLLYLGAGSSGLAYVLWAYGLRYVDAGRAAVFGSLKPLVGVLAATLVLDEAQTVIVLAGGLLLVTCIWLAYRPGRPESRLQAAGDEQFDRALHVRHPLRRERSPTALVHVTRDVVPISALAAVSLAQAERALGKHSDPKALYLHACDVIWNLWHDAGRLPVCALNEALRQVRDELARREIGPGVRAGLGPVA